MPSSLLDPLAPYLAPSRCRAAGKDSARKKWEYEISGEQREKTEQYEKGRQNTLATSKDLQEYDQKNYPNDRQRGAFVEVVAGFVHFFGEVLMRMDVFV